MQGTAPVERRLRAAIAAAAIVAPVLLAAGTTASAFESDRNFVLRHGSAADLQIYDARQRREAFQHEQRRFRQADRLPMAGEPRRPEIPGMQRNCRVLPYGNSFVRVCR